MGVAAMFMQRLEIIAQEEHVVIDDVTNKVMRGAVSRPGQSVSVVSFYVINNYITRRC